MARINKFKTYLWLTVAVGTLMSAMAARELPVARLDFRFIALAIITVVISSRASIKIPRVNTYITVSDTFIFLTMLLYGGEAAILVAAAEGVSSGLRISKTISIVMFNSAVMACSTTITAIALAVLRMVFVTDPKHNIAATVITVCTMALVQYVSNTGLVAVGLALKSSNGLLATWKKHYLWTSITYVGGAAAAGVIFRSFSSAGLSAMLVAIPIISIIYFTYRKYLEDIRATSAQAEESERKRAEIERERAEQAERHVEELNRHIAEQERISLALQESKEHFRHAAFHDALTGLPNRALLTDHIKLAIGRSRERRAQIFALLFLDLDRFKNVNDSLGHVAGDQLLVATARRLEECMRPMDLVARLGGDEFAILLDGLDDYSCAVAVAERIQQDLMRPFNLFGHEVFITASIGIRLSTTGYQDPENVLRDADTAMYRAKENGKARHELFDTVMHARAVELLQLENDLRRAVERREFEVYYQPIVSLETDRIAGFEALVRWRHPERGFIQPDDFIPLAEETGLIVEIGEAVLREACQQTRLWQTQFPAMDPLTISVNLSSKQFVRRDLINQVKGILNDSDLDPSCLKLEITESVVMENAEVASTMLQQLRGLGVQLSIDDFGTGYSSLSYLHRFPVNTLKIDRSFISRMRSGGENSEIVRTISTLANNLGMDVIAEGVETLDQLSQLKALNCHFGQGFLFSKPVDADKAGQLIASRANSPRVAEQIFIPAISNSYFVH